MLFMSKAILYGTTKLGAGAGFMMFKEGCLFLQLGNPSRSGSARNRKLPGIVIR